MLRTVVVGLVAPPLSTGRVHADQLVRALAQHRDPSLPTHVD